MQSLDINQPVVMHSLKGGVSRPIYNPGHKACLSTRRVLDRQQHSLLVSSVLWVVAEAQTMLHLTSATGFLAPFVSLMG